MSKENKKLDGRDAVQAIAQRYLTGEMSEYADDMIDELMALHNVKHNQAVNDAIARTKMQEACMWACRAVARPDADC